MAEETLSQNSVVRYGDGVDSFLRDPKLGVRDVLKLGATVENTIGILFILEKTYKCLEEFDKTRYQQNLCVNFSKTTQDFHIELQFKTRHYRVLSTLNNFKRTPDPVREVSIFFSQFIEKHQITIDKETEAINIKDVKLPYDFQKIVKDNQSYYGNHLHSFRILPLKVCPNTFVAKTMFAQFLIEKKTFRLIQWMRRAFNRKSFFLLGVYIDHEET